MLIKHLSLSLAALLAVSFITDSADAGHRRKFRRAVCHGSLAPLSEVMMDA